MTRERPSSPPGARRVLVVEDSSTQRESLCQMLERRGYQALEAATGKEACDLVEREPPDAILLDWELPDMDGSEVLRRWSQASGLFWLPVLIVTCHDEPEIVEYALEEGAADFVRKPPSELELAARLRSVLRIRDLQDRLRYLADRDPLTDLYNRRAFLERFEIERRRAHRNGSDLTVALLDLDHFKEVNDRFGHAVGDQVLVRFASVLVKESRAADLPGRLGGEEFALLLPETNQQQAQRCLERLRGVVRATSFGPSDVDLDLTFSSGVGVWSDRLEGFDELLSACDEALYRAKRTGRDRIEFMPELETKA